MTRTRLLLLTILLHASACRKPVLNEEPGYRDFNSPVRVLMKASSLAAPFGSPARVQGLDGFVEAPVVSPDGRALYYHRLDPDGFHIYRAQR